MTASGSTESDTSPHGPPCTPDSTTFEAPVQPTTVKAPPFFRRSRTPSSSGSSLSGFQSKKKNNHTGTWFYVILVLSQQLFRSPIELALSKRALPSESFDDPSGFSPSESPLPKMYPQAVEHIPQAEYQLGQHELFDPMIGKFTVDFNENPFFRSKVRWRNDAELAAYAWQTRGMAPNVNMLMTESQMPNYHATSDRACSSSSYGVSSRDPSLLDYDVIDVTWRNDIEREKNRVPEVAAPHQPSHSTTTNSVETQYERDLQVLHEKGFISTLSSDESSLFEELSKAQYADFYTSVVRPPVKNPAELTASSSSAAIVSKHGSRSSFEYPTYTSNPERFNYSSDSSGFLSSDSAEATAPTYDNITEAYRNPNEVAAQNAAPVLGYRTAQEQEVDQLSPSIEFEENMFELYRSNESVIRDVTAAVIEQRETSFDNIVKKVGDDAVTYNDIFSWTPFDEPLPIDDSFFDDYPTVPLAPAKTMLPERSTSPSSGFVSAESRSPSPGSSNSNRMDYRMYGKLVPNQRTEFDCQRSNACGTPTDIDSMIDEMVGNYDEEEKQTVRRRGRQSKDNELVKKYNLPASAEELANMSHKALQTLFKDPTLTDTQRIMIKKIRRRGRNKEAARKCRERRLNQTEVATGPMPTLILFPPKREMQ